MKHYLKFWCLTIGLDLSEDIRYHRAEDTKNNLAAIILQSTKNSKKFSLLSISAISSPCWSKWKYSAIPEASLECFVFDENALEANFCLEEKETYSFSKGNLSWNKNFICIFTCFFHEKIKHFSIVSVV